MKDDIELKDILFTNYHFAQVKKKQKNIGVYAENFETTRAKYTIAGQGQLTAGQIRQCKNKELAEKYEEYKNAVIKFSEECNQYVDYYRTGYKRSIRQTDDEISQNGTAVLMAFRNVIFVLGFAKKERTAMMYNAMVEKEKRWNNKRAADILAAWFIPTFIPAQNLMSERIGFLMNSTFREEDALPKECYEAFEEALCQLYEETYTENLRAQNDRS